MVDLKTDRCNRGWDLLVALHIRGLCNKLRLNMGVKVDEPALVFGDNKSVLCNARAPASTLKKKQYALAYHFVEGGVAREGWWNAYVNVSHDILLEYDRACQPRYTLGV